MDPVTRVNPPPAVFAVPCARSRPTTVKAFHDVVTEIRAAFPETPTVAEALIEAIYTAQAVPGVVVDARTFPSEFRLRIALPTAPEDMDKDFGPEGEKGGFDG